MPPLWWWDLVLALISLAAVAGGALYAWNKQRRIAAQRAAMDFISTHEVGSQGWREAHRLFDEITEGADHPQRLIGLLHPKDEEAWTQRRRVIAFLSHHEVVAVAIKHGIIDEALYKDWNRSMYLRTWVRAESFITQRRTQLEKPSIFENFEALATRWKNEA